MFFRDRVTVAVSCSFSWASEIKVSYSRTRGFTFTVFCGPCTSFGGSYSSCTSLNGGRLWSKNLSPSAFTTSTIPETRNTSSVWAAPDPPVTTSSRGPNAFRYRKTPPRVSGCVTPVVSSFDAQVSFGLTATTLPRTSGSRGIYSSAAERASSISEISEFWVITTEETDFIAAAINSPKNVGWQLEHRGNAQEGEFNFTAWTLPTLA